MLLSYYLLKNILFQDLNEPKCLNTTVHSIQLYIIYTVQNHLIYNISLVVPPGLRSMSYQQSART